MTTENQSADNAPSMGIDDHDNLDVFHSIEDIKQFFERLVDKTKSLQQENAQLKNDAKTDQATISRINEKLDEANEDKQELEQENAQLKDKLNFANPQLLSLTQANVELQKQVAELTQEVFDLKRNLSEPRNT